MACEYCEGYPLWNGDYTEGIITDLNTLLVFEKESSHSDEANINYCPMCGRDLRGDAS